MWQISHNHVSLIAKIDIQLLFDCWVDVCCALTAALRDAIYRDSLVFRRWGGHRCKIKLFEPLLWSLLYVHGFHYRKTEDLWDCCVRWEVSRCSCEPFVESRPSRKQYTSTCRFIDNPTIPERNWRGIGSLVWK